MDERLVADEALRLVDVDPRAAMTMAGAVLERARAATGRSPRPDCSAAAVAGRAAGRAALYLHHLDTAVDLLREAIVYSRRAGELQLEGEAEMSLAFALTRGGQTKRALRTIDAALTRLSGPSRTQGLAQRGVILHQLGRLDEALVQYATALPALRQAGDWPWVARVHSNRAVLRIYRSQLAAAQADLQAAQEVCRAHDLRLQHALVLDNVGFLHLRRGDVPAALRAYDDAERAHRDLGAPSGTVLIDRSELLLSAHLVVEARETAQRAVEEFSRLRRTILLPQAELLLAEAALLDHDTALARASAEHALHRFRSQERTEWAALACYTLLRCRLAGAGRRPGVRELAEAAAALEGAGFAGQAAEARLHAARLAVDSGRPEQARALLSHTRHARLRGPVQVRVHAWHGEAVLRLAEGRRAAASRALRTGVRILTEHQATLGATELRAHTAWHRQELVSLGLQLAVESGSARRVLDWAEQGRAVAALTRPVLPPDDPVLAQALTELRAVVAGLAEEPAGSPRRTALVREQIALEGVVRDRARLAGGSARAPLDRPGCEQLAAALGPAALVEFVELSGQLLAVTVVEGRPRLRRLCTVDEVQRSLPHIPMAMRRVLLASAHGDSREGDSALHLLRALGRRLDERLLRPLVDEVGDRPLVVVPTGVLQCIPWALLPTCRARPMSVAPSAALWHRAVRTTTLPGALLAVAGPGLPQAVTETRELAGLYERAGRPHRLLAGGEATVAAVQAALPAADVAHLATHGTFRGDNPQFSSLALVDAPLTVYDLESLSVTSPLVVLAACESGQALVLSGNELLGLSVTFLSLGTNALVASVVPVPDAEVAPLMVQLHRWLLAGASVSEALARVQEDTDGSPARFVAASGLISMGAGGTLRLQQ